MQTEVTDIDRTQRRVITARGSIAYDWLVVSAGIRVSYEPWFGNDRAAIAHTTANYASAYVPSAEHLALKQRIKGFQGGMIVMTLPPPPHRCPPSPYERACVMAARKPARRPAGLRHRRRCRRGVAASPTGRGAAGAWAGADADPHRQPLLHAREPRSARGHLGAVRHVKGPQGHLVQTQIDDNDRRRKLWDEGLRRYALQVQDMVGA